MKNTAPVESSSSLEICYLCMQVAIAKMKTLVDTICRPIARGGGGVVISKSSVSSDAS